MQTNPAQDAAFVSCDIVGHGEDADHSRQIARIASLNDCIRRACGERFDAKVVWASGGDGGHVAFLGDDQCQAAIRLIEALYVWAAQSTLGVNGAEIGLRLTAHYGPVSIIKGADERNELVGDGINVCGSLLKFGAPRTVLVTAPFRDLVERTRADRPELLDKVQFHHEQRIYLKYSRATAVLYMIFAGVDTAPQASSLRSDKAQLSRALEKGEYWAAIYHAKRLLQVNSMDRDAIEALQTITPSQLMVANKLSGHESHPLFSQMNRQSIQGFVRAAHLVERDDGEVICAQDDPGDAMFIIVKGQIGVVLNEAPASDGGPPAPAQLDVSYGQGHIVGELALALNRRRTATLQAIGPTALLSINYGVLRTILDSKQENSRLQRTFNEFLLDRSLRFLCSHYPYLRAGTDAPLADANQPWESLNEDAELLNLDWKDAEALLTSADRFDVTGLYILAGGRLVEASRSDLVPKKLDAHNLPLVYVNLPNTLVSSNHAFNLDAESDSTTVNIVRISDRSLKAFGPVVYGKLVEALRRQLASQFVFDVFVSYSGHDEHIAATWRQAMQLAGLRVYMSRPDAMRKFKNEIELALAESLVMVPFVSDRALGPPGQPGWVQREIQYRRTLFDEDHCNILPVELTPGLSQAFADGFSAIPATGDGQDGIAEAVEAVRAVRAGSRPPPYAAQRAEPIRI